MRVPEWLGAMSMWFTWKPLKIAVFTPTAITSTNTVNTFSSGPMKTRANKAIAGMKTPKIKESID